LRYSADTHIQGTDRQMHRKDNYITSTKLMKLSKEHVRIIRYRPTVYVCSTSAFKYLRDIVDMLFVGLRRSCIFWLTIIDWDLGPQLCD